MLSRQFLFTASDTVETQSLDMLSGQFLFTCPSCPDHMFSSEESLSQHMTQHDDKEKPSNGKPLITISSSREIPDDTASP